MCRLTKNSVSRPKYEHGKHVRDMDRMERLSVPRDRRPSIVAGILIGVFARKVHSLALGIGFGLGVGLLLAFIVAQMQHGYYFQIMLPGGMVGLIVGYATQRYGRGPKLQQT